MEAIADLPMLNDIDADYSPQYVKLARILRAKIESGQHKHGDALPAAAWPATTGCRCGWHGRAGDARRQQVRRHGHVGFEVLPRHLGRRSRARLCTSPPRERLKAGSPSRDISPVAEGGGDGRELVQRRLQVLDDLRRDHLGGGQVVGVLQRLVAQPEDVEDALSRATSSS